MIRIIIAIIVIIGIGALYFSSQEDKLVDEIKQETNLSFEVQGRVSDVNVSVGDTVSKGQVLAKLESEDKIRKLRDAKDNLNTQEEILKGLKESLSSKELREIDRQRVKVENTEDLFKAAQRNLISILNKSFDSADATIRENIDQFIKSPKGANPELIFELSDSDLKAKIELARFALEVILDDWSDIASDLTVENGLLLMSEDTKDKLEQVETFLDLVSIAVNSLIESDDLSQETIDGYVLDVSIASADVDSALSDILAAEETVNEANVSLTLEQNELEKKTEGTNYEEILAQEAVVESTETLIENIQAEIEETYLTSPIDGIVTEQTVEVGEIVSADEVVVVIIPQEKVATEPEIVETNIPQTNTTVTNPTYFGPTGPDDPITVELQNGETLELWPGWR